MLDAGVSPFLTEREVFDCPSRTARLCEAFWEYAHCTHTQVEYVYFVSLFPTVFSSFSHTIITEVFSGHAWWMASLHQLMNSA
jgi:hypothetical protein